MSAAASQVARRLAYAINAACAVRGDGEGNRLALLEEVSGLPLDAQRGFAEHFELVYAELRGLPAMGVGSSLEGLSTGNSKPDHALLPTLPKGVVW
jgi:hypothetical protein